MHCKYCGGNLTLEALYCPHCGKKNEQAWEHAAAMQRYQGEFRETKSAVHESVRRHSGITVRVIWLCVLLLAAVFCVFLAGESYSVVRGAEKLGARLRADAYRENLDALLEENNFEGFVAFIQEKGIATYEEPYEEYYTVYLSARTYIWASETLLSLVAPPSYQDAGDEVGFLCDYLESFYQSLQEEASFAELDGERSEQNAAARQEMRTRMASLLSAYAGLSMEEAEGFETLSQAQRMTVLEARFLAE